MLQKRNHKIVLVFISALLLHWDSQQVKILKVAFEKGTHPKVKVQGTFVVSSIKSNGEGPYLLEELLEVLKIDCAHDSAEVVYNFVISNRSQ